MEETTYRLKNMKGTDMESNIRIKGMSCQHCVMTVTKTIGSLEGVKDIKVSLEKGEASFAHDSEIDMNDLLAKLEKAGFEVG